MKNIKKNQKAIELHKVCMESIDSLVKSGSNNEDATSEVTSFINSYKHYAPDLLIASIKIHFLNKTVESVSEEMISKILLK